MERGVYYIWIETANGGKFYSETTTGTAKEYATKAAIDADLANDAIKDKYPCTKIFPIFTMPVEGDSDLTVDNGATLP